MLAKTKMAVVAVLVLSSASAALAQPKALKILPSPVSGQCITDEGQGRHNPCGLGGA